MGGLAAKKLNIRPYGPVLRRLYLLSCARHGRRIHSTDKLSEGYRSAVAVRTFVPYELLLKAQPIAT